MLKEAQRHYADAKKLVPVGAMAAEQLDLRRDKRDEAKADVDRYQYQVDNTTLVAPADGYVVNLQLRPGSFVRLKVPIMTFVSSQEAWLLMSVRQEGIQWVDSGDKALFALDMYPSELFEAEVDEVVWATGNAQGIISGTLPTLKELFQQPDQLVIRLKVNTSRYPNHPLRFGASGLATIFTGKGSDVFVLLRKLEIQSESWLNYLFNPF